MNNADNGNGNGFGMRDAQARCERCDQPARVSVLEGYIRGQPLRRQLCLACAEVAFDSFVNAGGGQPRARLSPAAILLFAGVLLTLAGTAFDHLGVRGSSGFGWLQRSGLATGGLFVVLGALLRVDLVAAGGTVLLVLTAVADVFGTAGTPGVGWRQLLAILTGLALLGVGLYLQRYGSPRRQRDAD